MRPHRNPTPATLLAISALATCCAATATHAAATTTNTTITQAHDTVQPTLEQRLESLAAALEERRIAEHIPGMSIAVVHNGKVVMAQGFGHANLDTKEPVTADTLFCIGSTTKSFTSALVALLADRGQLNFTDLATEKVPGLRFSDPETQANATIADLLAHRTGLTRMSLLWYNGTSTPQEILARVPAAENYAPFREAFLYNNVMYLAAGIACEHAVNSNNNNNNNNPATWDSLIESEFLRPLGMDSSLALTPPAETPGMATGYDWDKDNQTNNKQQLRNIWNVAPAGSIVSNANDMTRWIAFQLGAGTVDGQTIVTESNLTKTRTPFPNNEETTGYALGLFVDQWNETPYYQHGGNIDGFASAFSFMPEHNIGLSLLMNISGSSLQNAVHDLVYTHLLADTIPGGKGDSPLTPGQLELFAGEYLFTPPTPQPDTATWTASVQNGKLFLDVPGQTNYELLFPDEEGFWAFAVAPTQIKVRFKQEDKGKPATQLTLHQGGMEIILPREGTAISYADEPGALNADALTQYLGVYRLDQLGEVTFNITDGALAVDVPTQTNFLLNWPNTDNKWTLRTVPNAAIEFDDIPEGKTYREAFTLHQGGMKLRAVRTDAGPKKDDAPDKPLPTLDDITAARLAHNTRAIAPNEPGRIIYNFKLIHQGIEGTAHHEFEGTNAMRSHSDLGVFGHQTTIIVGDTGRESSSFTNPKELSQRQIDLAKLAHPTAFSAPDLRNSLTDLRVTAAREIDGQNTATLAFTFGTSDNSTLLIDTDTGDIIELRTFIDAGPAGTLPVTMKFPEWTTTSDKLRIPKIITMDTVMTGLNRMTLQEVSLGQNSGVNGLTQQLQQELNNPITDDSPAQTPVPTNHN